MASHRLLVVLRGNGEGGAPCCGEQRIRDEVPRAELATSSASFASPAQSVDPHSATPFAKPTDPTYVSVFTRTAPQLL